MCEVNYDDDVCSVFSETTPRARKPHRCDGCDAVIPVGTVHVRVFTVFDGDASSERECPACTKARVEFQKEHRFTSTPSSFGDFLETCIDEGEPGVERWIAMRDAIAARREAAEAVRA